MRLARSLELRDVAPVQLQVEGSRKRLADVAGKADRHDRVLPTPDEQRRGGERGQPGPEPIGPVRLLECERPEPRDDVAVEEQLGEGIDLRGPGRRRPGLLDQLELGGTPRGREPLRGRQRPEPMAQP